MFYTVLKDIQWNSDFSNTMDLSSCFVSPVYFTVYENGLSLLTRKSKINFEADFNSFRDK